MIKFKISAERFADACTVTEYIGVVVGNLGQQMRVLPKMLVDDNDSYIVEIVHDSEGDISELKNMDLANEIMNKVSVKRFEKLCKELTEASKNIVNPPKGGA
jgi:hypothetical protein